VLSGATPRPPLELKALLGRSKGGGSQSFPAITTTDDRCYIKAHNNPQGGRVVCTEYIVSAAGRLIGAPVCEVWPIRITPDFEGMAFPGGLTLCVGIGSASMEIPDAAEERGLSHRDRDDNGRRHVGVFALNDWCWGGDSQWLYCTSDEHRLFSHDHGWYLPPEGPDWSEADLMANVDVARELSLDPSGLDVDEIGRVADALEAVTRDDLRTLLVSVPAEWSVPNDDLEAVGFFLERRAPAVAGRMRAIAAKLAQP
jgi:hypothetical protein